MALTKITRHIIKPNENYDTHNINSTGIITAISANFSGNVSIAGTLTYDDVTNVDSIGIITARSGIIVNTNGLDVTGVSTFKDNIHLLDNDKLLLGADNDLQIFHSGSHSHITDTGTGNLSLQSTGGEIQLAKGGTFAHMIRAVVDAQVELYNNGSKKLETTSTGIDITGHTETDTLRVSGVSTFTGNVSFGSTVTFGDDDRIIMGDSSDLKIYHDGSNSYVTESGPGALRLVGNTVAIRNNSEDMAVFTTNAGVELYYDNSKKFETKSTGIDVTGHTETDTLNVSGISTFANTINVIGHTETDTLNVSGISTFANTISVAETIEHTGDTNTSISFPSNDYIRLTTSNSSRLNVTQNGYILLGTNSEPSGGDAHARNARLLIQGRIGNTADSGRLNLQRGSAASNGSSIGSLTFTDNSNNAYARIETQADAAPGTDDYPGRIIFSTTKDGESTPTEKLRITSDGKFGFGTNAPISPLDILLDAGAGDPRIRFDETQDNPFIEFNRWTGTGSNYYGIRAKSRLGDLALEFANITTIGNHTYSEKLRITSDGKVGIGSTNPQSRLDVQGDIHFNNNVLIASSGASNNIDHIWHDDNASFGRGGTWNFVSDGTKRSTGNSAIQIGYLKSSGGGHFFDNVGIGTNNPSAQLHIGPKDGDATPHLYLASSNNLYGFRIDTDDLLGGNVPLRIFARFNGTDTERIRVTQDGNVGINSTAPETGLDVRSDDGIFVRTVSNGPTNGARIQFSDQTSTDQRGHIIYRHPDNSVSPGSNDGFFIGGTENTSVVRVQGRAIIDEKVGVGTDDPATKLVVAESDSTAADMRFQNSSTGYAANNGMWVGINDNEDGLIYNYHNSPLIFGTNDNERLRITSSGNVSIKNDSGKFTAGTSDDLQIYHDGSNSYIDDNGTGDLQFRTINGSAINLIGGSEYLARFIKDGAVELYHNNSKKFETTSAGISVTGKMNSTSSIIAGASTGGVALTVNDGYGNANVTFNHEEGSPDIVGNSLRIETNVDSTAGNPTMTFEGAVASSAGGSLSLSQLLRLRLTEGADFPGHVTTNAGNFIIGSDAYGITWDDSGDDAARVYADRANNSFNIDLNSANSSDITTFKIRTYNSMGQDYSDVLTYDTTFEKLSISEIEHNGTVTIDANGGGADVRLEASDNVIINSGETEDGAIYFRGNSAADSYRFSKSGQTTIEGFLSFESLTTDRTFTFPDAGGTIALTSDISSSTNADTVDNLHAASFLRSDASDTYEGQTSGRVMRFRCVDGRSAGSSTGSLFPLEVFQNSNTTNSDAAMTFHIGGRYATYFGLDRETNDLFTGGWSDGSTKNRIWHAGNDGSGSGLDADTVDGIQGASFLRSDANDTATGTITFNADVNIRTALDFADGDVLRMGSSDDWSIYFNSNNWTYINQKGNGIIFQDNNTNIMRLQDEGVFRPENNNGGAIGSTTRRWNVGYFRYLRGQSEDTPGSGNTTTGFAFDNGGVGYISRASDIPLRLNRNSTGTILQFRKSNVEHGRVILNSTAAPGVSYSTNSDYRLKENVVVLDNAINRVKQLLPKRFNFIGNTHTVDGFLAHEAQTVVPEAVDGTKDEMENIGTLTEWDGTVLKTDIPEPPADEMTWEEMNTDENGNQTTEIRTRTWTQTGNQPAYQGIDQAKLVPLVTAALQEAIAKIEVLETQNANLLSRIEALE